MRSTEKSSPPRIPSKTVAGFIPRGGGLAILGMESGPPGTVLSLAVMRTAPRGLPDPSRFLSLYSKFKPALTLFEDSEPGGRSGTMAGYTHGLYAGAGFAFARLCRLRFEMVPDLLWRTESGLMERHASPLTAFADVWGEDPPELPKGTPDASPAAEAALLVRWGAGREMF